MAYFNPIHSLAQNVYRARPVAAPLVRPIINAPVFFHEIYVPVSQNPPRLQPQRFQAPYYPDRNYIQQAHVRYAQQAPVRYIQQAPVRHIQQAPVRYVQQAPVRYAQQAPVRYVQQAPVRYVQQAPVRYVQQTPAHQVQRHPVNFQPNNVVQRPSPPAPQLPVRAGVDQRISNIFVGMNPREPVNASPLPSRPHCPSAGIVSSQAQNISSPPVRNDLRPSAPVPVAHEESSSIGSIAIPTDHEVGRSRLNTAHLRYPVRDVNVPEVPLSFREASTIAQHKARELRIDMTDFDQKLYHQNDNPTWRDNVAKMFKRISHFLNFNEQEALRTGNPRLQEKVNEKWETYLAAFQIGSGDCNDPMSTQIENCYKDLFSIAPTSFEDKIQVAARELRDHTFDKVCSDYMRALPPEISPATGELHTMDQASALPFFKNRLQRDLGISSAETQYGGYCKRHGYGRHTPSILARFEQEYTAQKLVEHLSGRGADGKERISYGEVVDFLEEKTHQERSTIAKKLSGLDDDFMPTGDPVSKENQVAMVLRNLHNPMIA